MGRRPVVVDVGGGWRRATSPPHPALRPFLRVYVGYRGRADAPERVRTLPTRSAVLIVNLGTPLRLEAPAAPEAAFASFVAGLHDGHGSYTSPGGQRGVQLDLTPLGAYTLLGAPMSDLTNRITDPAELCGPGFGELVERMAAAPGWPERFDLLDGFLLHRLDIGPSPAPEVRRAWRLLAAAHGGVPVERLADEVGWSRRHLAERFRAQVGLPPKVASRVLRFQHALETASAGAENWAAVAASCGYADQAHLNREFRALAGCTPTRLLVAQSGSLSTTADLRSDPAPA
ncbi:helix-turn-helix domain-containing protein [Actinomadura parmotrematis]|uniref:AraC family transcriptional regulator n=1 Tax=Actinomadura parmotrematis TaxID=2864039 RepID=A0ABS7G4H7_9ACTN|nr:AraC family transcriptional regulator [Actinomadura parmotrematis]MBW8487125.1 AraC family transcriptional regulator [Actinomadura parmotrematis]